MYRLTLVKGYNTADIEDYSKLVYIGNPDFIEVKVVIGRMSAVVLIGLCLSITILKCRELHTVETTNPAKI